ncbi:MAG: hypothetical protein ACRECW_18145 [Phyllobacterium sp.]
MIQSVLIFLFGFLCAVILALMLAPPIWHRATVLTQRRIEAGGPQTLAEIQADKDGFRAEYAVATRKLEMSLEEREARLAAYLLDINAKQLEIRKLKEQGQAKDKTIAEFGAMAEDLTSALKTSDTELHQVQTALGTTELGLEKRLGELEQLKRHFANLTTRAEGLQIDLHAKEAELQKLSGQMSELRQDRRDAEAKSREIASELKLAHENLKAENKRYGDVQKKLEQMMTTLTDREEKLMRREKDYQRLDEQFKKIQADNRNLKNELTALGKAGQGPSSEADAALREQMNSLTAEVVAMVAQLEGPESPINRLLESDKPTIQRNAQTGEPIMSLAERIRILQKAAQVKTGA